MSKPRFKPTQYANIDKYIAADEVGSIRHRWMYGLRLLRDTEAVTPGGKSLKHGVTETLIAAAERKGIKLSAREIQYRLQCARAYETESQIRKALADLVTWWDLIQAGFPAFPADPDDEPADHRTPSERRNDAAEELIGEGPGEQLAMFPVRRFEPTQTTLKELADYMQDQKRITDNFIATGERRAAYFDQLKAATNDDLSVTWADAHKLAFGNDDAGEDDDLPMDKYAPPAQWPEDEPPLD